MRTGIVATIITLALSSSAFAEDLSSRVTRVSLFKNGLAFVTRQVSIPGPGTYTLVDVPEPVHGTFWTDPCVGVRVRATSRREARPAKGAAVLRFPDLRGRRVRVTLHGSESAPLNGTVVEADPELASRDWDRSYRARRFTHWWGLSPGGASGRSAETADRFLTLQTDAGLVLIESSRIESLQVFGDDLEIPYERSVLELRVTEPLPGSTLSISYLTKGISWAPSYRVDLSDPSRLKLLQKAVVRNELEPLLESEVELISGFPNIQFSEVLAPFSPRTSWAIFFDQLHQRFVNAAAITSNIMGQSAARGSISGGMGTPPAESAEGIDLHFQSIGPTTLGEGESLVLGLAEGEAAYERVVEWIIPDTRDANGSLVSEYERRQNPESYDESAWDAVQFRNPFSFPMTTGPAMVAEGGRFLGQRLSHWVNPGEETTVRITKALSLTTRHSEQEEEGEREVVSVGGRRFREISVRGELSVMNRRDRPLELVVRRRFSGSLGEAEGSPRISLREEGVYSVNPRHELTWTLEVPAGTERRWGYRYRVLVPH